MDHQSIRQVHLAIVEGRKKNNQRHKGRRRNAFDDNDDKEDDQPLAAMQALSI